MERRCPLITSLKDQSLRKIKFKDNKFLNEEIIFQGKIGRIRDIKIQKKQENYTCCLIMGNYGECLDETNNYDLIVYNIFTEFICSKY